MKERMILTDIKAIKAYSEPYKLMILQMYYQMHRPATVKQIADEMQEVPAKVHYHVKKLEAAGILKLVYTRDINGIIAKYFEPTAKHYEIAHHAIKLQVYENFDRSIHNDGLSQIFDVHKNHCIQATNIPTAVEPFILSSDLYLNQKEYGELIAYMENLQEKCKRKSGKKKAYKLLTSISQMNSIESV